MNTPKVIFFDVGATLLTPAFDEGATFSRIAAELELKLDAQEVMSKVPLMYGLYEQLYEQDDSFWSDDIRAQAIWIEMYEYLASLLDIPQSQRSMLAQAVYRYYFSPAAWKPFDDVLPLLDTLKKHGIRMGLISNWDSTLTPVIQGLGMRHYFETILASAVVGLHKPMSEIFYLALERMEVLPSEAMHVGDHPYADAKGAAAVGITPVLLDRNKEHPTFEGLRIRSLSEIVDLVPLS